MAALLKTPEFLVNSRRSTDSFDTATGPGTLIIIWHGSTLRHDVDSIALLVIVISWHPMRLFAQFGAAHLWTTEARKYLPGQIARFESLASSSAIPHSPHRGVFHRHGLAPADCAFKMHSEFDRCGRGVMDLLSSNL